MFSKVLRERLKEKYGRLPSAAFVAIHFNSRSKEHKEISQETARRWMRGVSMPSYLHLNTLSIWLNLDISKLFVLDRLNVNNQSQECALGLCCAETIKIVKLISGLSIKKQQNLLEFISRGML
jgi:transcriptional regulator with XRE-family HTH domain